MEDIVANTVTANFRAERELLTKLPGSACILPISIGSEYHEGKKFDATIELINQTGFHKCSIMVADSLQRHNILVEHPSLNQEKAYYLALKRGDEWLSRNFYIYSRLTCPYQICRWDSWLSHSEYKIHHKIIRGLYQEDKIFQQSIDNTIEPYLKRKVKQFNIAEYHPRWREICTQFLLEEYSVIIPMWCKEKFNFILYPNAPTEALAILQQRFRQAFHQDLVHWLSIRFRKRLAKPGEGLYLSALNHMQSKLQNKDCA